MFLFITKIETLFFSINFISKLEIFMSLQKVVGAWCGPFVYYNIIQTISFNIPQWNNPYIFPNQEKISFSKKACSCVKENIK